MAVAVRHAKVLSIPDGADDTVARPSDWNAEHQVTGLATVAETGAYSDLSGKPTLGALAAKDQAAMAEQADHPDTRHQDRHAVANLPLDGFGGRFDGRFGLGPGGDRRWDR